MCNVLDRRTRAGKDRHDVININTLTQKVKRMVSVCLLLVLFV